MLTPIPIGVLTRPARGAWALVEEVAEQLRERLRHADDRLERAARRVLHRRAPSTT